MTDSAAYRIRCGHSVYDARVAYTFDINRILFLEEEFIDGVLLL